MEKDRAVEAPEKDLGEACAVNKLELEDAFPRKQRLEEAEAVHHEEAAGAVVSEGPDMGNGKHIPTRHPSHLRRNLKHSERN